MILSIYLRRKKNSKVKSAMKMLISSKKVCKKIMEDFICSYKKQHIQLIQLITVPSNLMNPH